MKFSACATLALVALAKAQNSTNTTSSGTYAAGLLAALTGSNLTTLASLAATNAATLLPLLQTGNHTVFAPTDAALAAVPNATLNNPTLLAETILYHIYSGSYVPTGLNATVPTFARSALNSTDLVNLPGGQGQVAPFTSADNGTAVTVFAGTTANVTSMANATYENLQIYVIDKVLTIPSTLAAVENATSTLSSLTSLIGSYSPAINTALGAQKGITLFAPNNDAFTAAASALGALAANASLIETVLLNHVLNGTVLYNPGLETSNVTSASGEPLSFSSNANGTFVTSGNFTAQIVQSNILISNGVVHIIDNILANTNSNPAAASSAASSAIESGASATGTPTGAVGPTPSASTTSKPGAAATLGQNGAVVALAAAFLAFFLH